MNDFLGSSDFIVSYDWYEIDMFAVKKISIFEYNGDLFFPKRTGLF